MAKKKTVLHRMVPPEFVHMPHDKEKLVQRIALQRARVLGKYQAQALTGQPTQETQEPQALATETRYDVFPRSKTMRVLLKTPSLAAYAAVAAALLPLLLRRGGYKRFWRWFSVVSPLLLSYLEQKNKQQDQQQ